MQTVQGYEFRKEIGSGAYGAVYRAWQPAVGREVAVKVIRPEHASQPEFVQRFEAEAHMVARLEHPHIVPVYDYWRDDTGAYLVMRLLSGGSLKDRFRDGPLIIEDVISLADDICDALSAAHDEDVIHRDIKPSNILFDERGNAYLTDFGIAKNLEAEVKLTPTGAVLGTPDYISPEQIRGQHLTPVADQYSLGIVLYEALTGQVPYPDESIATLFHKHLVEPVPLLATFKADLPHKLDPILQRATAKEPADRYPDITTLATSFGSAVGRSRAEVETQPAAVSLPPFFKDDSHHERVRPVFVGRESELTWLSEKYDQAFQGQISTVFVVGDPGAGKSSLLGSFAQSVSVDYPDLLVAWGNCNAFTGSGDPYMPFRDIFSTLIGDIESRWAAGTLTNHQAQALWESVPLTTLSILEKAPQVVGALIPASTLVEKASMALPADSSALSRLRQKTATESFTFGELDKPQLFEQVVTVLGRISEKRPVLLLLDDFQWADSGSIDLLFHLGRRLTADNILIICAYRHEELMLGRAADRGDNRHPLLSLLDEFKRVFGDIWLDLGQAQDMTFIDAFVDSEPNNLDETFRETLFARTGGHPLFTVELLRELQERGDLIRNKDEGWIVGPTLNWDSLPARVEGVIEARIGRLSEELREILTVAAVEGEDFTAQVVARIQQLQERRLLRTLSQDLERRHQLVRERSAFQLDQRLLARYRFAHALFQRYLYNNISPVERGLLHGEIASILEELYTGRDDEIVVQLAWHFTEAGEIDKAVQYLLSAGDQARTLYAFDDAAEHYERALAMLKDSGDYERSSRILMKLGLTFHGAFDYERSQQAYEEAFELQEQLSISDQTTQLPPAPHALRLASIQPLTLDPSLSGDLASGRIVSQLFRGLVELEPKLDVRPDVARSWEMIEGGRTYVFHLRDAALWSDSVPVTAGDFVTAWRRALDPESGSPMAEYLYDIRGAEDYHQSRLTDFEAVGIFAEDAKTLRVELEQPISYFLQLLASARPVPQHVVENHDKDWTDVANIVSNGPFQLASFQKHHSIKLVRNPAYHGHFNGNVEEVLILFLKGPINAMSEYEAGNLDLVSFQNQASKELQSVIYRQASDHTSWPIFHTSCFSFATDRAPFNNPRLRRAFVLAADRRLTAFAGALPASGGLVPPGMPGHAPDIALPFDPDQARRILTEEGYPDGRGFPALKVLSAIHNANTTEIYIKTWRSELNLDITSINVEWDEFSEALKHEQPGLFTKAWAADYPDPDNFLRVGFRSLNPDWINTKYDELVEKARRNLNHEARLNLYRESELLLVQEAPIFPYTYFRGNGLAKPWIRGFRRSGMDDLFWKDIIIDPHQLNKI